MVTSPVLFRKRLMNAMNRELTKKLTSKSFEQSIRSGTKRILEQALIEHPTYQSMVAQDGRLRAELGVEHSASAMDSLVRDWVNSTRVTLSRPRVVGNRIVGTVITVTAIDASYSDVLGKAYASYISENEYEVPWLNWLLTQGNEILIRTHRVYNPTIPTDRSRTETNTIMKKTKGGAWGVPEEYAGTEDDNYATDVVVQAVPDIGLLFETEVKRRF